MENVRLAEAELSGTKTGISQPLEPPSYLVKANIMSQSQSQAEAEGVAWGTLGGPKK